MILPLLVVALLTAVPIAAQVSSAPPPTQTAPPPTTTMTLPAQPDVVGLNNLLVQIEQMAQTAALDLARLRIEKWKGDRDLKNQLQDNSDSLQRNLSSALPALISGVRNNSNSLAAHFKLYRNLEALYDVLASLTEAAGAIGPKDDFRALAVHVNSLDSARRSLADRIETATAMRDAELQRLQTRLQQAQAAPANTGPIKKIIVDDDTPKKKPRRKKPATPQKTPQ